MTAETLTLYVTMPLTFRVDDQDSMRDAAQLMPYAYNFDEPSLALLTPDALRDPSTALQAAAAEPLGQAVLRALNGLTVPGAALVEAGNVEVSYLPPGAPRSDQG
jgi:hypothetical protein